MSTVKVSNIQHGSAASAAITLDANGQATLNGLAFPTSGSLSGRNRIINGDMRIDQRNAGASVSLPDSTPTFVVDRFRFNESTAATGCTGQQVTDAPIGFTNALRITVGTGGSASATQVAQLCHPIEGFNFADLMFGTANARQIAVQFWVKASSTGTYCFSIFNSAGNRSYVAEYSIAQANTWEFKTITIAGDTTGTWLTNNGVGAFINWDIGSGANFNASAGSWGTTSYACRTTNQTNLIASSSATFLITGVQLEAGTVATPFERRSYGQELALCQRYLYTLGGNFYGNVNFFQYGIGQVSSSTASAVIFPFPVDMRASPTFSSVNPGNLVMGSAAGGFSVTTATLDIASPRTASVNFTRAGGMTGGQAMSLYQQGANLSQLLFSAEL